jgi:hypothetical protein
MSIGAGVSAGLDVRRWMARIVHISRLVIARFQDALLADCTVIDCPCSACIHAVGKMFYLATDSEIAATLAEPTTAFYAVMTPGVWAALRSASSGDRVGLAVVDHSTQPLTNPWGARRPRDEHLKIVRGINGLSL